jgi:hypothetical protein
VLKDECRKTHYKKIPDVEQLHCTSKTTLFFSTDEKIEIMKKSKNAIVAKSTTGFA